MKIPDVPVVFMYVVSKAHITSCKPSNTFLGSQPPPWQTHGRRQRLSPSTRSRMTAPTMRASWPWSLARRPRT